MSVLFTKRGEVPRVVVNVLNAGSSTLYVKANNVVYEDIAEFSVTYRDIIDCRAGYAAFSGYGVVTIDGTTVFTATSDETTYHWIVPSGLSGITIKFVKKPGSSFSTLTSIEITTT